MNQASGQGTCLASVPIPGRVKVPSAPIPRPEALDPAQTVLRNSGTGSEAVTKLRPKLEKNCAYRGGESLLRGALASREVMAVVSTRARRDQERLRGRLGRALRLDIIHDSRVSTASDVVKGSEARDICGRVRWLRGLGVELGRRRFPRPPLKPST